MLDYSVPFARSDDVMLNGVQIFSNYVNYIKDECFRVVWFGSDSCVISLIICGVSESLTSLYMYPAVIFKETTAVFC
jgi:hypothetical protein